MDPPSTNSSSRIYDTPRCQGMQELPSAADERAKYHSFCEQRVEDGTAPTLPPIFHHLSHGLALTVGSAVGSTPPSTEACLAAFVLRNTAGLTAGARAWSKHAHRSQPENETSSEAVSTKKKKKEPEGWWGKPSGPVAGINEKALSLFWRIVNGATWRNLHWLPHQVLVYEMRVEEGYGMRWYQDQGRQSEGDSPVSVEDIPWTFRGFVEPMMENGHKLGWRHPLAGAS